MKEAGKRERRTVLVVEDDPNQMLTVCSFLGKLGYVIRQAPDAEEGLRLLSEEVPDLLLSDINLPGRSGMEFLSQVRENHTDVAVVMMTAFSSIDSAIDCMRRGADDYLAKPLNFAEVPSRLETALLTRATRVRLAQLETQVRDRYRFDRMVGQSAAMQRVFQIVERVAPSSATVLICGRTGTGKELIARALHYNSKRASKAFVDINCGALPEQLVASELFGHQRGAFTGATDTKKGLFEIADGGTLFLDEVQALKPDVQTLLLRTLQERTVRRVGGRENIEVDVRIIASTNRDLSESVRRGEFREDLFYRINVVNIVLPELRERREDIPILVEHFLAQKQSGDTACKFDSDAMRTLVNYSWPGNVRELQNAVECALAIGTPPLLRLEDLPAQISGLTRVAGAERSGGPRTLDDVERVHILRVLEELGNNHTRAAEILGIDRRTLYRKLDKYKIEYSL